MTTTLTPSDKVPGYYILTGAQINAYFDHIRLPAKYRFHTVPQDPYLAKSFLDALIRYHAAAIPFENLTLHYDRSHVVTLTPDFLYAKTVLKKLPADEGTDLCNRGGYCLENAGLLLCILRSLHFDVYPTGGRINRQYSEPSLKKPQFESWGHLVNLVRIDTTTYLVDVGMSLGMPASAVPLKEDLDDLVNHGDFMMRIRRGTISEMTTRQQLWLYEAKFNKEMDWLTIMCFGETEFIQEDFERMNFYINGSRRYWMTSRMHVCKLILDDDEEGSIIGMAVLTGNVVKVSRGSERIKIVCETEADRIKALEKYFNIHLTRDETRGIAGLPSALPGADLYG